MSKQILDHLIETQQLLAKQEALLQAKKDEWEESNATLFDNISQLKDELEVVRGEMTEWAIANFVETGEKKPYGGITVQERKQYDYDEDAAIKWAESNAPIIVKIIKKLDKRKYQDYILSEDYKAPGTVDIVHVVAISPDLSEYH